MAVRADQRQIAHLLVQPARDRAHAWLCGSSRSGSRGSSPAPLTTDVLFLFGSGKPSARERA